MEFSDAFKAECKKYKMDPVVDPNGKLLLFCSEMPPQEVQDKIQATMSEPISFLPALRVTTRAMIGIMVAPYGVTGVGFLFDGKGGVIVAIEGDASRTALKAENPHIWGPVCRLLSEDPYTKRFLITLNDQPIRSSEDSVEAFVEESESESEYDLPRAPEVPEFKVEPDEAIVHLEEAPDEVKQEPAPQLVKAEETPKKLKAQAKPSVKINDDRFADDRDFLPKDVATDVQILLESASDSTAFLKALGVEI